MSLEGSNPRWLKMGVHQINTRNMFQNWKKYPVYQKGNPQLRVFLPNFWMKLVHPDHKQPENIVKFIVSIQMTDHDIKNYLEKIYNVPVVKVQSSIETGEFRQQPQKGYIIKDDDYKKVYITLPSGTKFEFPNLFKSEEKEREKEEEEKIKNQMMESYKKFENERKKRPGVPGWFHF